MKEKFLLRDKLPTDSVEINNSTAYFAEYKSSIEKYEVPKYVKIATNKGYQIFESKMRSAATASDIIISTSNLKNLGGQQENVAVNKVGWLRYWMYSFFHYNLWTFIGFIVALSGVIIDGLLKVGDAGYGIECAKQTIIFLKISSFILGIVGSVILFIRALAKK